MPNTSGGVDLSQFGGLTDEEKRKIVDMAAEEDVSAKEVITAFLVILETDGTWTVHGDMNQELSIRRQITGDDLVAASAVLQKDVYITETAIRTQAAMMQAAQQQMQQMQASAETQRIMQGLDLKR
jgi:hypothetical protein